MQYKRSSYKEAVETFEKAHEAGSGDHLSYLYLGKSYQKQDKLPDAIAALQKSIELKPENYSAHFALGSIYRAQEKYLRAAGEFKAALKASPKRGYRASFNYAVAMEEENPDATDQNIANWEAFVKLAKTNPRAKNDVAIARQHIKDLKEHKEQAGF